MKKRLLIRKIWRKTKTNYKIAKCTYSIKNTCTGQVVSVHAKEAYRGSRTEVSTRQIVSFKPRPLYSHTHLSWVGLIADINVLEKKKLSSLPEFEPRIIQPLPYSLATILYVLLFLSFVLFLFIHCVSFYPLSSCHLFLYNTNIHAPGGIWNRNPSKRWAADPALDRLSYTDSL